MIGTVLPPATTSPERATSIAQGVSPVNPRQSQPKPCRGEIKLIINILVVRGDTDHGGKVSDLLKSRVWNEYFGNPNALLRLIIF